LEKWNENPKPLTCNCSAWIPDRNIYVKRRSRFPVSRVNVDLLKCTPVLYIPSLYKSLSWSLWTVRVASKMAMASGAITATLSAFPQAFLSSTPCPSLCHRSRSWSLPISWRLHLAPEFGSSCLQSVCHFHLCVWCKYSRSQVKDDSNATKNALFGYHLQKLLGF